MVVRHINVLSLSITHQSGCDMTLVQLLSVLYFNYIPALQYYKTEEDLKVVTTVELFSVNTSALWTYTAE